MQIILIMNQCLVFVILILLLVKAATLSKKEKSMPIIHNDITELILKQDNYIEKVNELIDSLIRNAGETYVILNPNFNSSDKYITEHESEDMQQYIYIFISGNMTPDIKKIISSVYDISTDDKLKSILKLRIKLYILSLLVNANKTY